MKRRDKVKALIGEGATVNADVNINTEHTGLIMTGNVDQLIEFLNSEKGKKLIKKNSSPSNCQLVGDGEIIEETIEVKEKSGGTKISYDENGMPSFKRTYQ